MKRTVKKRNTAGFTMVEIAVALLLASILGMSLIGIVSPIYRIYRRTVARAEAFSIGENVIECIRQGAMRASEVSPDGASGVKTSLGVYTIANDGLVFIANGKEPADAQPLFDSAYYGGRTVSMTVDPIAAGEPQVQVTVTVAGGNAADCTVTGVVSSLWCVLND